MLEIPIIFAAIYRHHYLNQILTYHQKHKYDRLV